MESDYFRWILLVAGILLLAYIYLSGRSRRDDGGMPGPTGDTSDPLFTDHRTERKMSDPGASFKGNDSFDDFDISPTEQSESRDEDLDFFTPLEDMKPASVDASQSNLFSSIAEKIEAFSARLTPNRTERMEASVARAGSAAPEATEGEEKIISLNVMAHEGQMLDGAELYAVFTQRGYQFGEMGLFHSRYKDRTIFSIVNMVEPGSFDISTIETANTPGITLFLQLPGPIAADVLFEVLVSEASDMARVLGATVHDSDRSTLTKQTVQHMREDIYQYMHREKYFGARQS